MIRNNPIQNIRLYLWLFAAFVLFCPGLATAAEVTAYVNSNEIIAGSTINLTVEHQSDKTSDAKPDFAVLDKNFEVLGISKSISTNIVNMQVSMSRSWQIRLAPKFSGDTLEIPPIPVGDLQTKPINVRVVSSSAAMSGENKPDLFMVTKVENKTPYVQEQNVLTLQLFDALGVQGEEPAPPQTDKFAFTQLGKPQAERKIIGGKKYNVYTYRFAFAATQSGETTIPSAVFDGYRPVQGNRSHDPFDSMFKNFGFGGNFMQMPGVFSSKEPVRLLSDPIEITVKPKPEKFKGQWWLPADDIEIFDAFTPKDPQFSAGESVTRTLAIRAKGVMPEQIPDITPTVEGPVKVYPDAPETELMGEDNTVVTLWQRTAVYIPTKGGTLTMPEITLHWWDTKNNTQRTTSLPARTFKIAALDNSSPATPTTPAKSPDTTATDTPEATASTTSATQQQNWPEQPAPEQKKRNMWLLLAVALGGCFAGGLVVFALLRTQGKTITDDNDAVIAGSGFTTLKKAATTGEPALIRDAIIDIAKTRQLPVEPVTLFTIGSWLNDEAVHKQLMDINAALYGNAPLYQDWTGFAEQFKKAVKAREKKLAKTKQNTKSPVQELYPGRSKK